MWREAIKKVKNGITIDIEVSPNSKEEKIKSYNEWRKRIVVAMKEKPQKFKVNKELVSFFSSLFNVPVEKVRIASGEKSTNKTIFIEGVEKNEAESIIGKSLG